MAGSRTFLKRVLDQSRKADDLAARGETLVPDPTTGDDYSYAIVDNNGRTLGDFALNFVDYIDAAGTERRGLAVTWVEISANARGRGLGTSIYEFAAELACDLGVPLISDEYRSRFSEAFWRKQVSRRRATPIPGSAGVFEAPYRSAWNALYSAAYDEARTRGSHDEAHAHAMRVIEAWAARIPIPQDAGISPSGGDPARWVASRYELDACVTWRDLSGVRKKAR